VDRPLRGDRRRGDDGSQARSFLDLANRDRRAAPGKEMTAVDEKLDRAADKLESIARRAAGEGGLKAKLAEPLAEDADFLRKLKPSLIRARAKGELPTDTPPGTGPRLAPTGPQLRRRKRTGGGGGPNPFLVVGVALLAGVAVAKWLDWRGHAHPKH
jgi:hypothetical protein